MRYVLAAIFAAFFVSNAQSQSACFERGTLVKYLDEKYSESPIAAGLAANGSVLEVLTSSDGLSWTVVLTQPNGVTCVMASGEGWTKQVARGDKGS